MKAFALKALPLVALQVAGLGVLVTAQYQSVQAPVPPVGWDETKTPPTPIIAGDVPNHSKLSLERAYLDTRGGAQSSLVIPRSPDEQHHLHTLESRFAREDAFPKDPARADHRHMLDALRAMSQPDTAPVVIVNHPSWSAEGLGVYRANTPGELRNWNTAAPRVAVGMEGAPGHQAMGGRPDDRADSIRADVPECR